MPWLTPQLIGALTPAGLLMLGVLFIMLGWLVPRSVVKGVADDRDARLAEALARETEWRTAHERSEKAREIEAATSREALEVARTATEALKGFRAATALLGDSE